MQKVKNTTQVKLSYYYSYLPSKVLLKRESINVDLPIPVSPEIQNTQPDKFW